MFTAELVRAATSRTSVELFQIGHQLLHFARTDRSPSAAAWALSSASASDIRLVACSLVVRPLKLGMSISFHVGPTATIVPMKNCSCLSPFPPVPRRCRES